MPSRRDFLKLAAAATTATVLAQNRMEILEVFAEAKDYVHICWLNGAGCTGCSVSFAQTAGPDLLQVLTSITVGNSGLPIALPDWMYVIHPASGSLGVELIQDWIKHPQGSKILVVEGSMQQEGFCETGERDIREWVKDAASVADYTIAFGSCSAFGGIPNAKGNVTGAMSVQEFLREVGMADKAKGVINLPRCPGHPDSLVLSLASLLKGIVPELDEYNRPTMFYGKNMHDELCTYRPYFDRGIFTEFGQSEVGCRFKVGCKGPITSVDCASRKWNDGSSYCVEVGAPCVGCSEPDFPDGHTAPFFEPYANLKLTPETYVEVGEPPKIGGIEIENVAQYAGAAAGAGVALYAAYNVLKARKREGEKE